ncbi:MAG: hypothetical protein KAJ07_02350 [Planctomycetes bacterium]|nr:hypothetical protein [Planctomycetota bacterium]
MIDFFDIIIAAKNGKKFEWLLPLVFFAVYIVSAISKGKARKGYDEKLDAKLDEIDKEPMPEPVQAQPETIYIAPPKEILQKKLRTQQALAAQMQQRKTAKPKPQPRRAVRSKPKTSVATVLPYIETKAEAQLEILPETPESMIENIRQPQTIRDAIVFAEIIGKPRSLNQWQY